MYCKVGRQSQKHKVKWDDGSNSQVLNEHLELVSVPEGSSYDDPSGACEFALANVYQILVRVRRSFHYDVRRKSCSNIVMGVVLV